YKLNTPLLHTLHDYWLVDKKYEEGMSGYFEDLIHKSIVRPISNRYIKYVSSVSRATLDIHLEQGYFAEAKQFVVHNAIDINKQLFEHHLQLKQHRSDDNIHFLYVGQLGEYKGVKLLLDAFTSLNNANLSLDICGSGPLERLVEKTAKNFPNINYCGRIEKLEIFSKYKTADVLIIPSLWPEPFCMVQIEATQYACATFVSNSAAGSLEFQKVLKSGETFVPEPDKLRKSIENFANRKLIKNYIAAIPDNLEYFSLDRMEKEYLSIYNQMLEDQYEGSNR
ncbi:MAG: glycosyltransferase, partial [Enterococcus sp.]|nr:glycosyltransferase [Enterococcus sp.]